MPAISPLSPLETNYTVTDSSAFVADFLLDFNALDTRFFTVRHPSSAPALSIRLVHVTSGTSVTLASGTSSSAVPQRTVTATGSPSTTSGFTDLTCNITDTDGSGAVNERWQLRVRSSAPQTWELLTESGASGASDVFDVVRMVCDPVAAIPGLPATVLEQSTLTLTAALAGTGTAFTSAGLAAPTPTYRFGHTGAIAVMGLPSPISTSQTYQLVDPLGTASPLPGVYGSLPLPITVSVVHGGMTPDEPTFLSRTGTATTTIQPRPQRAVLVLDKSGSMGGQRWTNAKTAARLFVNLYAEFRGDVHVEDRIGIVLFEDDQAVFRNPSTGGVPSSLVRVLQPLDKPKQVAAGLPALDFGSPWGWTPIGDGLFAGMKALKDAGVLPDARYTVVLMTDGEENAGTIKVGPGADPANPQPWSVARTRPEVSGVANHANLNLFTIGMGTLPNHPVLSALANGPNRFAASFSVGELLEAFGTMLSVSQEVNKLARSNEGPDGVSDPNAVFFTTTSAQRFGVGVIGGTGTIEIARYDGSSFQVESIPATAYEAHHYIGVSNAPVYGTASVVWRIRRLVGSAPQALTPAEVMAYEDLHVKSEVRLDKRVYATGDDMRVVVRVRHDSAPVLGATVTAELDAPAASLSTLISDLDAEDLARLEEMEHGRRQPSDDPEDNDHPTGRAARIQAVMDAHGWKDLPRLDPADPSTGGLFVDGTDLLHDVDGDGDYQNTFARVHADGVYNWVIRVDGVDTDGNEFGQRLDTSALAAVGVSPKATQILQELLPNEPHGQAAVKVTITPRDDRLLKLGPGHDDNVIWVLRGAEFEHVRNEEPAPVNEDGTYTRTVLFKRGTRPTLGVAVNGVDLPLIRLTPPRFPRDWLPDKDWLPPILRSTDRPARPD
jgi:hypothetical protein